MTPSPAAAEPGSRPGGDDEIAGSSALTSRLGLPLWLGVRFARSPTGRYDVLVILPASFFAALVIAGMAGVPGVVQAQRDAVAAQLPAETHEATGVWATYAR